MKYVPTPSQTVGPFFSIGLSALCCDEVRCEELRGERVTIFGRVLDGDGQAVPDAVLEIWQAPARSVAPAGAVVTKGLEMRSAGNVPAGFARVATNEQGDFRFSAMKTQAVHDEQGITHSPHLVVLLFMRGLLRHLVTRIYFAGEAANEEDAVLKTVPAERRETLLAERQEKDGSWRWDVHLQGERETVFFDA